MPDTDGPNKDTEQPTKSLAFLLPLAQIFTTLIETFGWPGSILILGFWFVVWYATPEQKHEIIDLYVLGKGISNLWPIITLSVVYVGTLVAQRRWYLKNMDRLSKELDREGKEKSALQAKRTTKQLQHAKTKTEVKKK